MQNTLWAVPLLQIDRLLLENFRGFTRLEISFDSRLTVIVARNGCGKTAVLDALAVALGSFVGAFDVAKGVHFRPSDVRRIPKPDLAVKETEPQYPLHLEAAGMVNGIQTTWARELATHKSRTTYGKAGALTKLGKDLQQAVRDAAAGKTTAPLLPIVSYYGTGRLWSEKRFTVGKKATPETSRTSGYMDCLDSASHYKIFADWFERLCRAEYEQRDNPQILDEIKAKLTAVREAVDCVLKPSGWHGIVYKSAKAGIVAEHSQYGLLSVDWLSDGIRNMIALAADIAHRAVRLNSHLGANAVRQTPGIVLIDEVDMHLHPEWQQTVVASLRQAFPNIQFVVTTHSPQVLTTVRKEHIRLLSADGQVQALSHEMGTYGAESSRVLDEIFGVHSRPQNVETFTKLNRYLDLVEERQEMTEDGVKLRAELENSIGTGDHDLLKADIRISQLKTLRRP
jgi:predicted ATP-binding protein involved in virulence